MAKTNNNTSVSATINALPNKGKPNWGTLRGKPIVERVQLYNALRKQTIELRASQAEEAAKLYKKYPGYFKKETINGATQVYICTDEKKQVEFNEAFNAMSIRHKEANKKDKQLYTTLFDAIIPADMYATYVALATYTVDKTAFKEQVYKYLVHGLGIKGLSKQGLNSLTQTISDTIGLKLTSDAAFVKSDRDIEAMNKFTFCKTLIGLTRDILIVKNVIKTDPMVKEEEELPKAPTKEDAKKKATKRQESKKKDSKKKDAASKKAKKENKAA